MKKHVKIYLDFHGYTVADVISCEMNCGAVAVDIHHIDHRGMGGDPSKDELGNLIALCRDCHDKAEAGTITKWTLRFSKREV